MCFTLMMFLIIITGTGYMYGVWSLSVNKGADYTHITWLYRILDLIVCKNYVKHKYIQIQLGKSMQFRISLQGKFSLISVNCEWVTFAISTQNDFFFSNSNFLGNLQLLPNHIFQNTVFEANAFFHSKIQAPDVLFLSKYHAWHEAWCLFSPEFYSNRSISKNLQ